MYAYIAIEAASPICTQRAEKQFQMGRKGERREVGVVSAVRGKVQKKNLLRLHLSFGVEMTQIK